MKFVVVALVIVSLIAGAFGTTAPTTSSPTTTAAAQTTSPTTTAQTTGAPTTTSQTTDAPTTTPKTTDAPSTAQTDAPSVDEGSSSTGDEEQEVLDLQDIPASDIKTVCNLPEGVTYEQRKTMDPPFCIVTGQKGNSRNYTAFYPEVDKFTMVTIEGSYKQPWLDDQIAETYVRVEVGQKSSQWRRRGKGSKLNGQDGRYVVPFYTMIVELTDGKVQQLTWDDGCFGCEDTAATECVDGQTCGSPYTLCESADKDKKVDCDLKMYVGWFGTDKVGNYMTSAGKRLSRFRGASLKGAFDTAVKSTMDVVDDVKGSMNV